MCPRNRPNTHCRPPVPGAPPPNETPKFGEQLQLKLWENGLTDSPGPTGEPSLSEPIGARAVRVHKGLSDISVASLLIEGSAPATFVALKREGLEGYMVTVSSALTSSKYAALIGRLERTPGIAGESVSVGVTFEPMTPNLVPPSTAPSI